MVETALDIWNLALSACHAKGRLVTEQDNKKEAVECARWYPLVIQTVQEATFWPTSKQVEFLKDRIDVSGAETAPSFIYSYRLPFKYLRPRYLASYLPFELVYEWQRGETRLHTNDPEAKLIYTAEQDNVRVWMPGQKMATVYGLAGHIAGPLTGRGELIQKNFQLANSYLQDAQAVALNSEDFSINAIPEPILARGYATPGQTTRYFYPFGGMFQSA